MLRESLSRIQSEILLRPRTVLAACLVLVLLAAWLAEGVEFRTSRSELAPEGDPDEARWQAFLSDYNGADTVIACIEAAPGEDATAEELAGFADLLASVIGGDPFVDRVFHKFDTEWLLERGLYMLPADTLRAIDRAVEEEGGFLESLAAEAGLAELNAGISDRIEAGFSDSRPPADGDLPGVAAIRGFLERQRDFLESPRAAVDRWTAGHPLLALAGERTARISDGYARTHDGRTLFVIITPRSADDSLGTQRELIARLRQHAQKAVSQRPGFKVAFTGTPAMTVEEMDTVRRDTWRTSIVAVVGVALLVLLVFRWRSHSFLVLAALAIGILWSFGAVRLEYGYLNLITSAFISTLIGVGVAYGIHPVSEYELAGAHTADPAGAVREAYRRTGTAVASAGFTTSVAFFSILLMRFRGFAELGLVAGVGVLLCLLAALVALPAILVLYGSWRHGRDRCLRDDAVRLDRFWLERMAGRVCRAPRTVIFCAVTVTGLLGWTASGLRFDTNILELLPRGAESAKYQRMMTLESDLSPVFNLVVSEDLEGLSAMHARAGEEPSIGRFESALSFLPERPDEVRSILARWAERLDRLEIPSRARPLERSALVASLEGLEEVLARAGEAAFTTGRGELAGPLEEARAEAERCLDLARAADGERVEAWSEGQDRLVARFQEILDLARAASRVEPPAPDNLPEQLRARFFTRKGQPIGFLYPAESVFDPDHLERYHAASLRVSPDAIGFPFMFHKMSGRITTGFYRAVAAGSVFVMLILLIDLRSVRDALLAAAPLAIGIVWTLGLMPLLGLSFNFANLVAMPLIVGVGIDNGVHVIHRVRLEGSDGMNVVLRHTGRAILISSLTTMIGFGSLALASHRGIASLGLLLLIGVGSCLVASTLILPNLLVVLGICPANDSSR